MLEPFKGEFLFHPAALDYSGNVCSNACAYCFASLRSEDRRAQVRKLSNLCLGKAEGRSHTDWLFNQGYPICVSNRSDPFATSNRDNTGVVLQLLDMVPNGVFFQTKGLSKGVDYSLLDGFKKKNVVMYITIDTIRDDICKRIEPGAPLPEARFELAEYAKKRGWFVYIGINPCWKPWLPEADFDKLVEKLDNIGVDNYFLQPLSLNSQDVQRMNEARRKRLPDEEIKDALTCSGDESYYVDCYYKLVDAKKNAHIVGTPLPSRVVDLACNALGKAVNSAHSFVNYAWDESKRTGKVVYTFDDFLSVMFKNNPEMREYSNGELYKYIMCINRALWKSSNFVKSIRDFGGVYKTVWNEHGITYSPLNNCAFSEITKDGKSYRDDYGNKVFYFLGRDKDQYEKAERTIDIADLERKGVTVL